MSPGKTKLLERLVAAQGAMRGADLSRGERSIATKMQADGLVRWKAAAGCRHWMTCDSQTLSITDAGREALAAVP